MHSTQSDRLIDILHERIFSNFMLREINYINYFSRLKVI